MNFSDAGLHLEQNFQGAQLIFSRVFLARNGRVLILPEKYFHTHGTFLRSWLQMSKRNKYDNLLHRKVVRLFLAFLHFFPLQLQKMKRCCKTKHEQLLGFTTATTTRIRNISKPKGQN